MDFGILGPDLSPGDILVMSWLRLQHASDWIQHPYWMLTKCFGTLIWSEWTYGSTLTLLGLCRWGVGFGVLGADLSPSPSDCNVIVEATAGFRLDPTSILDV